MAVLSFITGLSQKEMPRLKVEKEGSSQTTDEGPYLRPPQPFFISALSSGGLQSTFRSQAKLSTNTRVAFIPAVQKPLSSGSPKPTEKKENKLPCPRLRFLSSTEAPIKQAIRNKPS